jgi:hypothetical protein
MNRLEDFLKPTQTKLFADLRRMFKTPAVYSDGNYILVMGEAPIMLLAHLDTVHKTPVTQICKTENGNILMSPEGIGGDDRCGVYALVKAYRSAKKKPWLLFTCNEETGGLGAQKFCEHHEKGKLPKTLDELKLLIEIDRKGKQDAVYYDCANPEFEKYITGKGFKTDWGSFSDISYVAPELGVAAVNLSSGYYNAHTLHEYINRKQLNLVVTKVEGIIAEAAEEGFPKYEYVESPRISWRSDRDFGSWGKWDKADSRIWLDDTEDTELADIPMEILDEYIELSDFHSYAELDALRKEHGDQIIKLMYDSEISMYERYTPKACDEQDDNGGGAI